MEAARGHTDEQQQALRADILYTAAEAIRIITALVYPVIPDAAARVWAQLGLGDIRKADLKNLQWRGLQPGTKLGELSPLFPRADKETITRMNELEQKNTPPPPAADPAASNAPSRLRRLPQRRPSRTSRSSTPWSTDSPWPSPSPPPKPPPWSASKTPSPSRNHRCRKERLSAAYARCGSRRHAPWSGRCHEAPGTRTLPPAPATGTVVAPAAPAAAAGDKISIDDFSKVELRVAQVKVAERVPKADKLLRLEVDLGYETRQILAGIAEAYTPESLIGRKVVIVANLAPRKLRGYESNGMIVAASVEGGKPVLAGFLEDVEIGARLK